eukprot:3001682-Pyramimonas_sp.AAC.1
MGGAPLCVAPCPKLLLCEGAQAGALGAHTPRLKPLFLCERAVQRFDDTQSVAYAVPRAIQLPRGNLLRSQIGILDWGMDKLRERKGLAPSFDAMPFGSVLGRKGTHVYPSFDFLALCLPVVRVKGSAHTATREGSGNGPDAGLNWLASGEVLSDIKQLPTWVAAGGGIAATAVPSTGGQVIDGEGYARAASPSATSSAS